RNREPRPGEETDKEGEQLALRDESACGHGQARRGAQPDDDARGDGRHHADEHAAAWRGADDLRRSGLLEGGGPPTVPRRRCSLPSESARYGTATADGSSEDDEPESIENACARRARLPHREAALGIYE